MYFRPSIQLTLLCLYYLHHPLTVLEFPSLCYCYQALEPSALYSHTTYSNVLYFTNSSCSLSCVCVVIGVMVEVSLRWSADQYSDAITSFANGGWAFLLPLLLTLSLDFNVVMTINCPLPVLRRAYQHPSLSLTLPISLSLPPSLTHAISFLSFSHTISLTLFPSP